VRFTPVLTSVAVTIAFGTTAPELSVTVPCKLPVDCARAAVDGNATRRTAVIPNSLKILQLSFIIAITSKNERLKRNPSRQESLKMAKHLRIAVFTIGAGDGLAFRREGALR
jgi:hypothetical protein